MSREENFKYEDEEKKQFFEILRLLSEYQVGNSYYFLADNQIVQGLVGEVYFKVYDYGLTHTARRKLTFEHKIILLHSHNRYDLKPNKLFKTKEEAADQFLNDNAIPKELLKVLKTKRTNTKVSNLIEKLKLLDPNVDLEDKFQEIINEVTTRYLYPKESITTEDYWDCNCEEFYIHPLIERCCTICGVERAEQPDATTSELAPHRMSYNRPK